MTVRTPERPSNSADFLESSPHPAETGAALRHRTESGRIPTPDHGCRSVTSSSDLGFPGDLCNAVPPLTKSTTQHLRHSFAPSALALGENLPVIGKLMVHADIETTARYAHLEPATLHEAAEPIAVSVAANFLWRN